MTLRWLKPDEYHIRTTCGRFTVCRLTCSPFALWYVAWQRDVLEPERATEIGATRVPITAPEHERQRAIREMQQLCEATA